MNLKNDIERIENTIGYMFPFDMTAWESEYIWDFTLTKEKFMTQSKLEELYFDDDWHEKHWRMILKQRELLVNAYVKTLTIERMINETKGGE